MTPVIREAKEADIGFVLFMWTNDSYELECTALRVTKHGRPPAIALYKTLFHQVAMKLLKRSVIIVAVNPDDNEQVFGCLVYEPGDVPVIHYSGTKREFRGLEVDKKLFEWARVSYDKPAIHTGGMPAGGDERRGFRSQMPKAWSFVRYGLLP